MTTASSNLWALVANDPTHPAVRALCDAVAGMLDVAELAKGADAGLFEGGAAGLAVGRAWPRIGPALRAAATRLGWRPLVGGTAVPDSNSGPEKVTVQCRCGRYYLPRPAPWCGACDTYVYDRRTGTWRPRR